MSLIRVEVAPIAKVSLPDGTFVEGPIHVQPGIADYTLILLSVMVAPNLVALEPVLVLTTTPYVVLRPPPP